MLSPAVKIKKPIKTKFRMPVFNWVALKPNQINGTVFNEIDDERILEVPALPWDRGTHRESWNAGLGKAPQPSPQASTAPRPQGVQSLQEWGVQSLPLLSCQEEIFPISNQSSAGADSMSCPPVPVPWLPPSCQGISPQGPAVTLGKGSFQVLDAPMGALSMAGWSTSAHQCFPEFLNMCRGVWGWISGVWPDFLSPAQECVPSIPQPLPELPGFQSQAGQGWKNLG